MFKDFYWKTWNKCWEFGINLLASNLEDKCEKYVKTNFFKDNIAYTGVDK